MFAEKSFNLHVLCISNFKHHEFSYFLVKVNHKI